VLIDCRTGFSGMSASVLFHIADLAVVFLALTEQIWDGVDVLLQAVAAARTKRDNRPGLLFVPSMVPSGEVGREKTRTYLTRLGAKYSTILNVHPAHALDDEMDLNEEEPWLREGITGIHESRPTAL